MGPDPEGRGRISRRLSERVVEQPRVAVWAEVATPWTPLDVTDRAFERCRAFITNPQRGWSVWIGQITETPFVGVGLGRRANVAFLPIWPTSVLPLSDPICCFQRGPVSRRGRGGPLRSSERTARELVERVARATTRPALTEAAATLGIW